MRYYCLWDIKVKRVTTNLPRYLGTNLSSYWLQSGEVIKLNWEILWLVVPTKRWLKPKFSWIRRRYSINRESVKYGIPLSKNSNWSKVLYTFLRHDRRRPCNYINTRHQLSKALMLVLKHFFKNFETRGYYKQRAKLVDPAISKSLNLDTTIWMTSKIRSGFYLGY